MQIYIDGVNRGTFYNNAVEQTYGLTAGAHRVTVQAKDTTGLITKNTIYFTVSGSSAVGTSVSITSPLNNAIVSTPIVVRATATAATGRTISSTTIYLDGANIYTVKSATVSTSIAASTGVRRLTVQTRDSMGVYAKSTIYVTVK
jgi:hypothetical protein